ncbi:hypothetical protein PF1251 [Pyrococcus furiosus DSM 3638]|uniref:Alpha-galactosidase NEW3 domain-containing protein n=1 Tax=Pyrococcus furiosus (strain ATCC 43587 / DSM 3638 / JCM 8422 / Vc1) TaxID=186497 RepID=Q8U1F7_PYRFU|nr:NEW3 domain-containing protein [Pyrococcus furiosus]AAL81375.1 hypothetical protein PF1251 [Pyrococcus furiosus DSM 3638]
MSVEIGVPEGWDAHSLYMGSRVSMIHLSEEDSKTLEISLDVPRGADLGRYEIPVTLSISGNEYSETKVVTFFVNIYKTYKGENATLNILIIDEEGNPVPKAKVIVGDKEMGTDSSGKAEISIKPGEYEIYVEKEGYEKASKKVEVEDGEVKDVKIILSRKPYYFAVDTESDVYSILLGTPNPPFLITIENLGKNSDEYRLSVRGLPENWNAMFTLSPDSNLEVNKVEVDPGQSKNVYLSVYPSLNALPGDYNLTIIVESISSGTKEEIPITVHLIGTYEMYVNLMNYRLSITAGEEKTTEIEVVNYGNAPVTNVKIEVSAPQGWKVEVDPDSAPMVAPKDRFTSTLKVKVPEGTPAGEYRVTIKVTSDQQEWQDTLRVVVRQRSTSAYIGLALLIVAFLVVIIMIRRVGRR